MKRLALVLTIASTGVAPACTEIPQDTGDSAFLAWGGDVLAGGTSVGLSESIPGDALLAGDEVSVSGSVAGSAYGVGREVTVDAAVEGSVWALGGTVRVQSAVGRNIMAAGGDVQLGEGAVVGRNAYLAAETVVSTGTIEGSLRAAGSEVTLDGPVSGDVIVEAGALSIGPRARIGGSLRYRVQEGAATIDPAAQIEGLITALPPGRDESEASGTLFQVLRVLAFLVAGAIVVALFPGAATKVSETARSRTLVSLGLGLVGIVAVPVAIVLFLVTVIGVPAALIALPLYLASVYLAPIPVAIWLGDRLMEDIPQLRWGRLREFLLGGAILSALVFVPVGGFFLRLVVTLIGLGAAALAIGGGGPGVRTTEPIGPGLEREAK